jgi:hypothetical protein
MNFCEILYGDFIQMCRDSSRLGKIGQKYQAFRRIRKVAKSAYDLSHVHPKYQSGLHWTDLVKFDTEDFYENLSGKTNLVKVWKKYRARIIVSGVINRHKSYKSDRAEEV